MALVGKDNIVEHVNSIGYVYWKIYQDPSRKTAGNFVGTADFTNDDLTLEQSLDGLRKTLSRMSAGFYILTVYPKQKDTRGGIDTSIQIESSFNSSAISGIAAPASFRIEGFGEVTPDNFEEAITAKLEKIQKAQKEKEEHERVLKENAELKKQLKENEGGVNRGLLAVGSVLYATMSKSEAGKEFIGMIKEVMVASRGGAVKTDTPGEKFEEAEVISGHKPTSDEERLLAAVEKLSKDNPEFLEQIEMMAKVKQTDPEMFKEGIDTLKTFAG